MAPESNIASRRDAAPAHGGFRTPLAEKVFLDRYALKATDRDAIREGDVVVFCPNPEADEKRRRREIGVVTAVRRDAQQAEVRPRDEPDAPALWQPLDHLDKPLELQPEQMYRRVARAVAAVEPTDEARRQAEARFFRVMAERAFVPGGRILAGAGAGGQLTFFNCFVLPSPHDSRKGIMATATQQLEIMSRGGGVGINVSSLRPRFDSVEGVNGRSSGAVSWADFYSILTGKVEQGGSRRGALMIILDDWHPDIEQFVEAKHALGTLDNANISVAVSDAFMEAVEHDADWPLVFPDRTEPDYDTAWDGDLDKWRRAGKRVNAYRTVKARHLYDRICASAWASAEPGLFFVDRVNALSNSYYYQAIKCTNPCGEQPLPPWGVCNLGALNLGVFCKPTPEGKHFWPTAGDEAPLDGADVLARLDLDRLRDTARAGLHFLDNVIDVTPYFFEENAAQQRAERRVGLGVMGLAELLIRMGVPYGSPLALEVVARVFETTRDAAYEESIELARARGPFPRFLAEPYLQSGYARQLPERLRDGIARHGVRNVTLLTVAPTGTTGTMMGTSTGIEPYFLFRFESRSRLGAHVVSEPVVADYCREMGLLSDAPLPPQFQTTEDLTPRQHAEVMAVAQRYVDAAISKTCNLPNQFTVEDVKAFYRELYRLGCKGGTVYRDGSRQEQALVKLPAAGGTAAWRPGDASANLVKPLPGQPREGWTHSLLTPLGRVHVTLNLDPLDGSPFDIFIALSKAGSDIDADTDAIGRLLSVLLRLNVDIPSRTRLELAIDQIRGIATSRSAGLGPQRVRSVPDGIARCLEELLKFLDRPHPATPSGTIQGNGTPAAAEGEPNGEDSPTAAETGRRRTYMQVCPACGNATAAYVDGCFKCFACGYSEC
ncbi:MAG TPA: adenosylcobalamin-dependent ribonucleoside-diphosphate reductase [Gemmataceae bacterium]|nr:adenosylcobalamin-dependent ribonucleoside-diphosphate reductase [Gemmataceae bacterium]